jgi:hypothetical protein
MSYMKRTLPLLVLFTLPGIALAQSGGLNKVVYVDKKTSRVKSEEGEVRESAAGVKLLLDGKEKLSLSPAEVVRVEYADLPGIGGEDRGMLASLETERDPVKARAGFGLLLAKATAERSRKYLAYRELQAATRVADMVGFGEEFKREAGKVADDWSTFLKNYPGGWEVWPVGLTRSRLLDDIGETTKAAEALDAITKTPGLPAALRVEAALARCEVMLRGGAAAGPAVDAVGRDPDLPADGLLRERFLILQAWVGAPKPGESADSTTAKLQAILDAARDPAARAAGFNAKGDLLLAHHRPKDARWEYLWVETVYSQNKEQHAHALRRLVEVFDTLGDKDRADQYREKWKKLRAP